MTNLTINSTESFEDFAVIVDVYGAGSNQPTQKGVDGYQVDFDVTATNKAGETKDFHIVYQTAERSDSIAAYNGHEMETAGRYGCDSDESAELEDFMDYEVDLQQLKNKAEILCKEWKESNAV